MKIDLTKLTYGGGGMPNDYYKNLREIIISVLCEWKLEKCDDVKTFGNIADKVILILRNPGISQTVEILSIEQRLDNIEKLTGELKRDVIYLLKK